mmetsp:Transcript_16644/g.37313  ORF Transcript_16644/g.37313 Transcript_16644/m.37313 type:complete len:96 (+) Transcript_16644:368-655(+)
MDSPFDEHAALDTLPSTFSPSGFHSNAPPSRLFVQGACGRGNVSMAIVLLASCLGYAHRIGGQMPLPPPVTVATRSSSCLSAPIVWTYSERYWEH